MKIGKLVFLPWYPVIYAKLWMIGKCTGDKDMQDYAIYGMNTMWRRR